MVRNGAKTSFDVDASPSGFFALRTPLLPYAILSRWGEGLEAPGVDQLLTDLNLSLEDKLRLVRAAREGLGREFGVEAPLERQFDARYRRERPRLEALLDRRGDEAEQLASGLCAIDHRSERVRALTAELEALAKKGALSASIQRLAASYVHMHINRLLRAAARAQELLIYDFLRRLYTSQAARRQGRDA
jgi:thiopeptide-type bacteriocin biosynthesis protein